MNLLRTGKTRITVSYEKKAKRGKPKDRHGKAHASLEDVSHPWQGEDIPSVMSEHKGQVTVETQAFRERRLVEVPQLQMDTSSIKVANRVPLGPAQV